MFRGYGSDSRTRVARRGPAIGSSRTGFSWPSNRSVKSLFVSLHVSGGRPGMRSAYELYVCARDSDTVSKSTRRGSAVNRTPWQSNTIWRKTMAKLSLTLLSILTAVEIGPIGCAKNSGQDTTPASQTGAQTDPNGIGGGPAPGSHPDLGTGTSGTGNGPGTTMPSTQNGNTSTQNGNSGSNGSGTSGTSGTSGSSSSDSGSSGLPSGGTGAGSNDNSSSGSNSGSNSDSSSSSGGANQGSDSSGSRSNGSRRKGTKKGGASTPKPSDQSGARGSSGSSTPTP
jgi:hypothetical protein